MRQQDVVASQRRGRAQRQARTALRAVLGAVFADEWSGQRVASDSQEWS